MKVEDLDRLIRQLLLDSIEREQEREMEAGAGTEGFEPSARHRRQMQSMLEDPLKWVRRRQQPVWKLLAQRAAAIFLVGSLSFAAVITASSDVRATVLRWVMEQTDNSVMYTYGGEAISKTMPKYEIAILPDGYVESVRTEWSSYVSITYENPINDDIINFSYSYMQEGGSMSFDGNTYVISDTTVNGCEGKFFKTTIPGNFNYLTWIDTEKNLQFAVDSALDEEVILHMAESIFCTK